MHIKILNDIIPALLGMLNSESTQTFWGDLRKTGVTSWKHLVFDELLDVAVNVSSLVINTLHEVKLVTVLLAYPHYYTTGRNVSDILRLSLPLKL